MKRFAVLGAGLFLLGGCALPIPVQVASWALDGLSYIFTEKSVTDHGISVLARKDCAILRGLLGPGEFCRDFDDTATALAEGMPYDGLFTEDETISAEIAAIAEFETAGGGDEGEPVAAIENLTLDRTDDITEEGYQTNARPVIGDSVEAAASLVSAALIFEDRASLDGFPQRILVEAMTHADFLARQQAALGDVEDMAEATAPQVAVKPDTSKDWAARTSRIIETGLEPAARTTRIMETGLEPAAGYYFVIGSFRNHANARNLRNQFRVLRPSVLSAKLDVTTVYRVVVGPFTKIEEKDVHQEIFKAGIANSWTIQVKPGDWRMALVDPPATAPVEVADAARPEDVREWSAMNYTRMLSRLVY